MKKIYGLILLLFFIIGTINVSAYNKEEHIADLKGNPDKFVLNQNYPNPFNPETVIRFGIPSEGDVSHKIFNATGELVSSLVNERMRSGEYEIKFNAANLNSGVYFYVVENEGRKLTGKMILLK
jgi:hypothetical protein